MTCRCDVKLTVQGSQANPPPLPGSSGRRAEQPRQRLSHRHGRWGSPSGRPHSPLTRLSQPLPSPDLKALSCPLPPFLSMSCPSPALGGEGRASWNCSGSSPGLPSPTSPCGWPSWPPAPASLSLEGALLLPARAAPACTWRPSSSLTAQFAPAEWEAHAVPHTVPHAALGLLPGNAQALSSRWPVSSCRARGPVFRPTPGGTGAVQAACSRAGRADGDGERGGERGGGRGGDRKGGRKAKGPARVRRVTPCEQVTCVQVSPEGRLAGKPLAPPPGHAPQLGLPRERGRWACADREAGGCQAPEGGGRGRTLGKHVCGCVRPAWAPWARGRCAQVRAGEGRRLRPPSRSFQPRSSRGARELTPQVLQHTKNAFFANRTKKKKTRCDFDWLHQPAVVVLAVAVFPVTASGASGQRPGHSGQVSRALPLLGRPEQKPPPHGEAPIREEAEACGRVRHAGS